MSAFGATRAGRKMAERLMADTCEIRRSLTASDFNPDLLEYIPVAPALVYEGRCRIHGYQPQESTPDSGQHIYTVQRYFISIPVGQGPVAVNDVIEITGSTMDPVNIGRRFRVASLFNKTFATAQRLMVDEVTA